MKKIIFVIGGMTRGGAERVISILANQYAKNGWAVDIVMMLDYVIDYELDSRINLIDMTADQTHKLKSAPSWIKNFRVYVKKQKPDVIVSFVARINLVVLAATIGMSIPIIISERNDPAADGRSKLIDIATKILYRRSKTVVFQTQKARNHFSGKIKSLGRIIPNPISVECNATTSKKKIVTVGRLSPQKNHKMLIEAFLEVAERHPDYELWIYGEGNLRDELGTIISEHHLEGKVFLPVNIPDIHQKIADAEMFVLSSDYEGLSNALLEAMMMGLPCISTNCAGSDEYIKDGVNGLLVPVGDKKKMAMAIERLIEDNALRTSIGKAGKKSVEQCDSQIVMKKWCETIEG